MANKTVKTRLQIKHDTSTNWGKATFNVLDGELIYYTDTKQLKIGDGTKTPKDLPVYADGVTQEDLDGLLFAGSDSHGGAANSAKKLTNTTKIGSATEPVYFSASGVPVKCGTLPYAAASTPGGAASSAEKLDLSADVGTTANPVYFHDGVPVETNIPWAKGATTGDRPALYANKIIKGNVASGVDHHVGGSIKPIYIDTNGVPQECTGISSEISYDGVAAKATQLEYSTTFNLTGAVNATGVSFNGQPKTDSGGLNPSNNTANINVTNLKEAYLAWGGKNINGSVTPLDTAISDVHRANRFAFMKPEMISISYAQANGNFIDYGASDTNKVKLVSGIQTAFNSGNRTTNNVVGDKVRIEISSKYVDSSNKKFDIYCVLRKLLIYVSTTRTTASVTVQAKPFNSSTPYECGTFSISGWSGWNSIPVACSTKSTHKNGLYFGNTNTGYATSDYIEKLILTFNIDAVNSSSTTNYVCVHNIIAIGDTCWSTVSDFAKNGHMYTWDENKNVVFPGSIAATNGFRGTADVATKLGTANVGDDDEPIYLKAGVPTKGKRIPSILTGTTAPTASLGQNGDIYLMPYANNMPAIYSGTAAPASTLGVDGDIYILYE